MKKRMAKAHTNAPGEKAVPYQLIPQTSDVGRPMYERLYALIDAHHEDLSHNNVKIALAWALAWKPDTDGHLVLGKCKKATDLDRELAPYDFVILINRDFWQNVRVDDTQRAALLDHELCHAAVAFDQDGHAKRDERGRTLYRIRKHDIEEFRDVVARHGCYKADLEAFFQAIAKAESRSLGWVGYARVGEALASIGIEITIPTIATWSESERREVMTWAQLRQEADTAHVNIALSQSMPEVLRTALGRSGGDQPPLAVDATTH